MWVHEVPWILICNPSFSSFHNSYSDLFLEQILSHINSRLKIAFLYINWNVEIEFETSYSLIDHRTVTIKSSPISDRYHQMITKLRQSTIYFQQKITEEKGEL